MIARRVLSSIAVAFLLAVPAVARGAGGDGDKVLVFPVSGVVPDDPGNGGEQLTGLLARSAGLLGGVVKVSQAAFPDAAALAGCETQDAGCYDKVAATLHVGRLVLCTVEPAADGTTVTVRLEWFDAATAVVERREPVIPAGTFDELKGAFLRTTTQAFVGGEAPPPELPPAQPEQPPVETPPAPIVPAVVPPAEESERSFDLHRVGRVPWIVAGSGVVLAAAGTVFLIVARSRQHDVDSAPTDTPADLDHLVELEDEGARYTTIGDILLIGGAAVAIGGGAWAVVQATRARHPAPAVSIAPLPLHGGGGLVLSVPLP